MSAIFRRGRAPQGKIHSVTASSHRLNTFNITMSNFDIKKKFIVVVVCKKDVLIFTFCSSQQSHQASNLQGRGSHNRKTWIHGSSSYPLNFSSGCPSFLYFSLAHFLLSGVETSRVSRKLRSEKFPSNQFVAPCLETVFRPNLVQNKKCLSIIQANMQPLTASLLEHVGPKQNCCYTICYAASHDLDRSSSPFTYWGKMSALLT